MPDSTQVDDPSWQFQMAQENIAQLSKFIAENAAVMDPINNNKINITGDTIDPDLVDLAAKGYASHAIMLQIVRELRALRNELKKETSEP